LLNKGHSQSESESESNKTGLRAEDLAFFDGGLEDLGVCSSDCELVLGIGSSTSTSSSTWLKGGLGRSFPLSLSECIATS